MEPLRLGVIGLGVMGSDHLKNALRIPEFVQLVAGADPMAEARARAEALGIATVATAEDLFERGVEAVIVANPHPQHEAAVVAAAERGIHVLCEKPIAATVSAADRMVAACRRHHVLLAMDFQQRTTPIYQTLHRLLSSDAIGELSRVALVATAWYRTQAYYDSGSWRGTWEGEGGGVVMNQAPHQLDMYVWLSGLPHRVKASTSTRIHRIETENTVAALFEYEGGRVDTFITTTAEYPGKVEWTYVGDRGTLVCDGRTLRLYQLESSLRHQLLTTPNSARPAGAWEDVTADPIAREETGHVGLLRQFALAVRNGTPPIASGEDGVRQLELANAIILSGLRDRPVDVPVDRGAYDQLLQEMRQRDV
ncbi:MAG TPA: Gfo/Idh/MocA family oxidoreductase [Chloroflexota bacterium]